MSKYHIKIGKGPDAKYKSVRKDSEGHFYYMVNGHKHYPKRRKVRRGAKPAKKSRKPGRPRKSGRKSRKPGRPRKSASRRKPGRPRKSSSSRRSRVKRVYMPGPGPRIEELPDDSMSLVRYSGPRENNLVRYRYN